MKNKLNFNFIIAIAGIIYVMFSILPLFKSLFKKSDISSTNKEGWVDYPLLIEK